tara:strand:+ start:140 stop:307 length:168 start_codon:yes stop_codon:yes gene_type:complete
MLLEKFSLAELSIAVVSILGALGLCLRGSRCSKIKTPCCNIEREILDEDTPAENP